VATQLTFSIQGNPDLYLSPFSGVLNYSIAAPNTKSLLNYTAALSSSTFSGNNRGTFDLTGSAGTAAATYVPVNISQAATKTYASTEVLTDAFTASLGVTEGAIESWTQSIQFQNAPVPGNTPVPGPLPILGAAAAFGSVRKLRQFSSALKQG
jgi:hypothetical protein